MDKYKRSLAKTLTYRIISTIAIIALVFIFTKDFVISGAIGGIDLIAKLIIYFLHERIWNKVPWGKKKPH